MTSNPNHVPSQPETATVSDEVRSLYDIDAINEWRSDELARLNVLRVDVSDNPRGQYVTEFLSGIEDELDSFLASKGINSGVPEYNDLRRLYRNSSIDRAPNDEWDSIPKRQGVDHVDTRSQMERVKDRISQWRNDNAAAPEPVSPPEPIIPPERTTPPAPIVPPDPTTPPELGSPLGRENERTADVIRGELDNARKEWAAMQAKRQGRLWDRRPPGYDAAKLRYERLKRELGVTSLDETLNDDNLSDDEKNVAVVAYIFDENNKLRALTTEEVEGTRINRFVKSVGGWLNTGNGWVRLGKGVAVGVGVGAVGAGVGLLVGAAGAGAAVAGGAALIAKAPLRFTKAYAQSDAKQGRGMGQLDDSVKSEWAGQISGSTSQEAIDQAMLMSDRSFESDTKKEQRKRRKTTAIAMGGVALGSLAAVGVGSLLDHTGVSAKVKDSVWGSKSVDRPDGNGDATERRIDDAIKESEDRTRREYDQKIKDMQAKIDDLSKDKEGLSGLEANGTDVYEFGYSTAPEHLLEDIVKEHYGVSLSGSDSYKLINYLMAETNGNIFEGVKTEWNTPGKDVWIMDSGGKTSGLSDEARRLIDYKLGVEIEVDGGDSDTGADYGPTGSDEASASGLASTGVSVVDETPSQALTEVHLPLE